MSTNVMEEHTACIWRVAYFYPDDGGNIFLRSVGTHPRGYT